MLTLTIIRVNTTLFIHTVKVKIKIFNIGNSKSQKKIIKL